MSGWSDPLIACSSLVSFPKTFVRTSRRAVRGVSRRHWVGAIYLVRRPVGQPRVPHLPRARSRFATITHQAVVFARDWLRVLSLTHFLVYYFCGDGGSILLFLLKTI